MPFRSTAMQRSQSSGRMSSTLAVGPAMPALFTSTSRPPRVRFTSSKSRSTSGSFATSATVYGMLPCLRAFSSTSQTWTRAPWSAKVWAMTRPMPAPPAVTSTRSPLADVSMAKENEPAISSSLFFYAALVMAFRYANFFRAESRWKIAVETWAMIAVITWSLWFTGRLHSPLLNAYLLVVITSALTLGKVTTLVEVALIAACYVFLAGASFVELTSLAFLGALTAQFAPVVLVAYITTMFAADIRYVLQRAKLLSELDELTGLFNTRGFAIAADRLFGQALRYARPASMLMVDLDNLKAVNDSHGHEAGNRLLRHTANALRAELRYTDLPARYGGDEFIVLLPE